MKELANWKEEQFRQMRDELDRLFRDFLCDFAEPDLLLAGGEVEPPSIKVSQEKETVVIGIAYPGLVPADLEISVSPEMVLVRVDRQEKLGQGAGDIQRRSQFVQQVKLPCRVDPEKAEAVCFDHRLEIRLPKIPAAAFRKVDLRRAGKSGS